MCAQTLSLSPILKTRVVVVLLSARIPDIKTGFVHYAQRSTRLIRAGNRTSNRTQFTCHTETTNSDAHSRRPSAPCHFGRRYGCHQNLGTLYDKSQRREQRSLCPIHRFSIFDTYS